MHWLNQMSFVNGPEMLGFGLWPLLSIVPLMAWIVVWKGWALWIAARRGETLWFVVLLVFNTVGLLEIFYIFAVAKRNEKDEETTVVVDEEKSSDK